MEGQSQTCTAHHSLDWDTWHLWSCGYEGIDALTRNGRHMVSRWRLCVYEYCVCSASSLMRWKLNVLGAAAEQLRRSGPTCFSAYYSDSVPTAAYSAAVEWRVRLRGALLIFTDGNNSPVVMNGAVWWEIRSKMRSGRDNGVFPEDYPAIRRGLLHVWPISSASYKPVKRKRWGRWRRVWNVSNIFIQTFTANQRV